MNQGDLTSPAPSKRYLLIPILLPVCALAAFLPALNNGFVHWDDPINILGNPHYRGLGWANLRWMFTCSLAGHYQPLTWLSYAVDYVIWGMQPMGYHLANMLWHAANTVLFFEFVRRLIAHVIPPQTAREAGAVWLAGGLTALLFAVHPLRVESVAWVTERRDVVSGFFILLTLLAYLHMATSRQPSRRRRLLILTLALFLCALLSKVIAVTLLAVFTALDVYPLGRLSRNPRHWLRREARSIWLEKFLFLIPAGLAAVASICSQSRDQTISSLAMHDLTGRLTQCCYGLAFYVYKTVLPLNIYALYELHPPLNPMEFRFIASFCFVAAVTTVAYITWRRMPALMIAWFCYIAVLSPVLGLFQNGPQLVADRYSYLSCWAWHILLAAGLVQSRALLRKTNAAFIVGGGIALAACCSVLTWQQCKIWKNSETLWLHTLHHEPNSRIALTNLAGYYWEEKRPEDYVVMAKAAIRLGDPNPDLRRGLDQALNQLNRPEESVTFFKDILAIRPDDASTHNSLAVACVNLNRVEEALPHFVRAVQIDPTNTEPIEHLKTLRAALPNNEKIMAALQEALRAAQR